MCGGGQGDERVSWGEGRSGGGGGFIDVAREESGESAVLAGRTPRVFKCFSAAIAHVSRVTRYANALLPTLLHEVKFNCGGRAMREKTRCDMCTRV